MAKLRSGDPVPDKCTTVDFLPTRQLGDVAGDVEYVDGSGVTQKGKLFLSARKPDYIAKFEAEGLEICNDADHHFAYDKSPLTLALGPRGGLQVYFTSRDFTDVERSHQSYTTYWPGVMQTLLTSGAAQGRIHVVVIGYTAMQWRYINEWFDLLPNKPPGCRIFFYFALNPLFGPADNLSEYFNGLQAATPETTALLVIPPAWTNFLGPGMPTTEQGNYRTAMSGALFTFLRAIKMGTSLMVFSQVHDIDAVRSENMDGIMNMGTGTNAIPDFPGWDFSTTGFTGPMSIDSRGEVFGGYAMTADGTAALLGLTPTGPDSSEYTFTVLDEDAFASYGLKRFVTQGSDLVEFGGTMTQAWFDYASSVLGVTI